MSDFEADDLFADVDLGADFLDEPDVLSDASYTDTVTETEVVSETWFMEFVTVDPVEDVGGLASDVVLPDPFQPATGAGAGAAALIGAWLSRRTAGAAAGPQTLAVEVPRSGTADAQALEVALRAEPGVQAATAGPAADGAETIAVVVQIAEASAPVLRRLVAVVRNRRSTDAVLVLPDATRIPVAQIDDTAVRRLAGGT